MNTIRFKDITLPSVDDIYHMFKTVYEEES